MMPSFPRIRRLPENVLFVCTGNLCRSIFAEGLFTKMLAHAGISIETSSAGTQAQPDKAPPPSILRLLETHGAAWSGRPSRRITAETIAAAGIIFTMENVHREKVLALVPEAAQKTLLLSQFYSRREILPWGTEIPDPMGRGDFFHENVAEIISVCCANVLEEFKRQALKTAASSTA